MDVKARLAALGLAGALTIVPVWEGLRLKMYRDPIGIPTDCFGHTGKDVRAVNTIEQCYEKFYVDIIAANKIVDSCVAVPLNPNQRSAFASFAFNVGPGRKGYKDGFCVLKNGNQPAFLRALNKGDYVNACYGLTSWVNAAGKPMQGLINRRNAEMALCMKGYNGHN